MVGVWQEVEDEDVGALIADIYAERERDRGRRVELED